MTEIAIAGPRVPRALARTAARTLGNVFLGVALGLTVYYTVTNIRASVSQRTLRGELDSLGAVSAARPERLLESDGKPVLDFSGWAEQDRAYWLGVPDGGIFGRLVIPGMALDTVVVKHATRATLKRGPGWIGFTDLPGPTGNVGISGHRTTFGAPFRRLDVLAAGDTIDFYSPYRRYRYRVVRTFQVTPDRVDVVAHTEEPMLTLTACHPPYSARYRLIVQAILDDVRVLADAPAPGKQ
ncbi:MAG: class E sortase [Actinomycetota bacterium]|nr:class E sortase [Actinomycetota bacterium]